MLLPAATLSVAGCATDGGDFCDLAEPLRPSTVAVADYLSENDPALARDVLEHNLTGATLCGWQP